MNQAPFLLARPDRGDRRRHRLVHLLAQTVIGDIDVAAREVRLKRGCDVVVALADLRADEIAGVFFGVSPGKPLRLGDPERDRLVSARDRLEAQVLS